MYDSFLHLVAFLSPGIGSRSAVFQVCTMPAFNQSNAIVLIAKCKMFFQYFSKIYYIFILYLAIKKSAFDELNAHIVHT